MLICDPIQGNKRGIRNCGLPATTTTTTQPWQSGVITVTDSHASSLHDTQCLPSNPSKLDTICLSYYATAAHHHHHFNPFSLYILQVSSPRHVIHHGQAYKY
jgi:hypothetical protein